MATTSDAPLRFEIATMALGAMALGAFFFYRGLSLYHLKKTIEYTPTSKAISVSPGTAEASGVARPGDAGYLISPFGNRKCVYYYTSLYKWSGSGKQRHKELVDIMESSDPITIEDETGRILVEPEVNPVSGNMDSILPRFDFKDMISIKLDLRGETTPDRRGFFGKLLGLQNTTSPDDPVVKFVQNHWPELADYGDKLEVAEIFIEDGDPLYVLGTAELLDPDEVQPRTVIRAVPGKFFCMVDGTEKTALSQVGWQSSLCILAGPPAFFLGYLALSSTLDLLSFPVLVAGSMITACMYLSVLFTWLFALYNGLILLRNNIDRASANIDVLLEKRYDLISRLAECVSAYSQYEKDLNLFITELRATAIGQGNDSILAVMEQYPVLKANESFKLLQTELAQMENEIAGSRSYFNDSVMLYNKQIASFPYFIIALALGLKPIAYVN